MKKSIITFVFLITLCCSFSFSAERLPEFGGIDFDIKLNSDGTMDVIETWNMIELYSNVLKINVQTNAEQVSDIKVFRKSEETIVDFISGDYKEDTIKTGNYTVLESGENPIVLIRYWKI